MRGCLTDSLCGSPHCAHFRDDKTEAQKSQAAHSAQLEALDPRVPEAGPAGPTLDTGTSRPSLTESLGGPPALAPAPRPTSSRSA